MKEHSVAVGEALPKARLAITLYNSKASIRQRFTWLIASDEREPSFLSNHRLVERKN